MSEPLFAQQIWTTMHSPEHGLVVRADTTSMEESEREGLLEELASHGISAKIIHSNTFNCDYIQMAESDYLDLKGKLSGEARVTASRPERQLQIIGRPAL